MGVRRAMGSSTSLDLAVACSLPKLKSLRSGVWGMANETMQSGTAMSAIAAEKADHVPRGR
jgi:hypothetical protein